MNFLSLALNYWPYIAIAVLFGAIVLQHANNKALIAAATTLKVELQASQASVQQLTNSVKEQNTAIDALKADSDARQAKAQAALTAAAIARKDANTAAQTILSMQRPQNVNACDAANNLINGELKK